MLQHFNTLEELTAAFPDEQTCIRHFRAIRWANGAFCPYCGRTKIYHFADDKTHKCGDCRQRFSIKIGTIFEDTKLPLHKWFIAIWLITSHKKGIASTQLARDDGVTQKTAWFMTHRLREAAKTKSFNKPLKGDGELKRPSSATGNATSTNGSASILGRVASAKLSCSGCWSVAGISAR